MIDLPVYDRPIKALEGHPLFDPRKTAGIVTAENPMVHPPVPGGNAALKDLLKRWNLSHEEVEGHYGAPEKSLIVVGPTREQMFDIGRKFGQEAVIYGQNGKMEMLHTNGPKVGHLYPSHGSYAFHPTHCPPDYYTHLPGRGYLRLHFDEGQLQPAPLHPAAWRSAPPQPQQPTPQQAVAGALKKAIERAEKKPAPWAGNYAWHEPSPAHNPKALVAGVVMPSGFFQQPMAKAEPPGKQPNLTQSGTAHVANEQAAVKGTSRSFAAQAAPYGKVDPSRPSVLKHYPYEGKHDAADALIRSKGYQVSLMGGKHGKPDFANRNYGTGHLLIWDPGDTTTGDYGEASYQKTWRGLHELAHAETLPRINAKYGEGRRMGALGKHRTLREAKRAVEWEHLAFLRQRELSKQIGVQISDEDFNREYNTGMADAISRAVAGRFVDPQAEGLIPHSTHTPPLSTSLAMIDQAGHQMGLRGEHDLLPR